MPLHLHRLARYLQAKGESVGVVSLAAEGPVSELLRADGIDVGHCDATGPWDWRAVAKLATTISERRPDVVHSLLFHANIAARLACVLAGFDPRRLICEIQTAEIERCWHLPVDRWTHRLCRCTICNSPSVLEHLASAARMPRSRLRLIHGGVDVDSIALALPASRQELGIPDGDPLLLWVGRLDPIKGLDVLVEAAVRINKKLPVRLAIVGDGTYRDELRHIVARSGIADRIHMLGARSDVPRLLKAADVFVFPSRTEGLPNSLLEAMAAALPIITTDAPGCRDLIDHESTGLLVPVDQADTLAVAIVRVLEDRELGLRLGRTAAQRVARNFPLEKCFESYRAAFRETLSDPS